MRDRALGTVLRYRIVDDRDGRVLAEHADAEQALRSFGPLACNPLVSARVTVVEPDDQPQPVTARTIIGSLESDWWLGTASIWW